MHVTTAFLASCTWHQMLRTSCTRRACGTQELSAAQVNEVGFSFTALRTVRGSFTVEATYEPVSPRRVAISFSRATLVPEQLQKLFQVRGLRCLHRDFAARPRLRCSLAGCVAQCWCAQL